MVKVHGFNDPASQEKMAKDNAFHFKTNIDRNMLRSPDRMIHVFSTSKREFKINRLPLWPNTVLKACPKDERYIVVAHVPDPLMQSVHDVLKSSQRAEANDGMLCAVELLNPNNPTYDPDFVAPPELAAVFGSSKGCNLFDQGLFLSLTNPPSEKEILQAEKRRENRYKGLLAHADSLEATNRKELEEFIKSEDGQDLRMALDFFGEQREYHKPMIAMRTCPNCGEPIKSGVAFHVMAGGVYCVNDWERAVSAGVKTKSDVPEHLRWWDEADEVSTKPKPGRPPSSK